MTKDDKKVLDDQIRRWTTETNNLAGKIAVAKGTKGTNYALLLVMPQGTMKTSANRLQRMHCAS
ncbi:MULTISPECIES: hypothetical protein [unclassified Caballeronia]|uniref:hypothetical protein n=1 Tax=unclassified Caballeronia TaxID=2646786 RepID=UPI002028E6E5|nr:MULTISPECIES: hypothetical protein [unclassified Caballeronia]